MKTAIMPQITSYRKILGRPTRQPLHTVHSVAYELGKCFQLDKNHCVLIASMDEQGGADLCVGNDAFVFSHLDEIAEDKAIPLNWPDPNYHLKSKDHKAFLAKFPVTGGFIPLGATLADGRAHPGAGTGVFVALGMTFNQDRTAAGPESEVIVEFMQGQWDGTEFKVTQRSCIEHFLGKRIMGDPLSYFLADGEYLLAPFTTPEGIVVFRFAFNGTQWEPVECGEPFVTYHPESTCMANLIGENEPSLQKVQNSYYVYTRGYDPVGRLYHSTDGLNYTLCTQRYNNMVPQALNQLLDGTLYIATNPNMDWLRNPLIAYPLVERSFDMPNYTGEPWIIHDQDGIRDNNGQSIPFVDHAVSSNVFLEGCWRHLLWYRISDLKARSAGTFKELQTLLGDTQARPDFGGLYACELITDMRIEPSFLL